MSTAARSDWRSTCIDTKDGQAAPEPSSLARRIVHREIRILHRTQNLDHLAVLDRFVLIDWHPRSIATPNANDALHRTLPRCRVPGSLEPRRRRAKRRVMISTTNREAQGFKRSLPIRALLPAANAKN